MFPNWKIIIFFVKNGFFQAFIVKVNVFVDLSINYFRNLYSKLEEDLKKKKKQIFEKSENLVCVD